METNYKNELARQDVIDAANESKKEIKREERAVKKELRNEFREFKSKAREGDGFMPDDIPIANEARKYAKQDVVQDARDGIDSIDDLRDDFLDGKGVQRSQTVVSEMKDVVAETALQMETDIYE